MSFHRQYRLRLVLLLFVLIVAAWCFEISHGVLYGTSGSNGRASKLYEIDTKTGQATLIGSITVHSQAVSINGLAFDRTDRALGGQMYAHTSPFSPNYPNCLLRLDVTNGVGELVGQSQFPGMADLAIDNFGTIYGMYRGTNPNQRIDDLAKFDTSTAYARLFGDAGISLGNFGMDFDRLDNDNLHLVNFVNGTGMYYSLSVATGQATMLRNISNTPFECGFGTINPDGFGIGLEYWCPEVDFDGGVNINTRIQILWLPLAVTMTTIQTPVTDLTTLAFTFDTTMAPSNSPSKTPTKIPSKRPSQLPSRAPSIRPTDRPSTKPSQRPSRRPSASPTRRPSRVPSVRPSISPSKIASSRPSRTPSARPSTSKPSRSPSEPPSKLPSRRPSVRPSRKPSQRPTRLASSRPTVSPAPSSKPSRRPSTVPTKTPSRKPSKVPSRRPSARPSRSPVIVASGAPSKLPSKTPTRRPSSRPSRRPSSAPSKPPTIAPTVNPCLTNQCTYLFIFPGRWVRSDFFGVCIERCVALLDFELALGSKCGRCPP